MFRENLPEKQKKATFTTSLNNLKGGTPKNCYKWSDMRPPTNRVRLKEQPPHTIHEKWYLVDLHCCEVNVGELYTSPMDAMGPVKPIHFRSFIGIPCHSIGFASTIGSGPTKPTKPRRRNDDFSL